MSKDEKYGVVFVRWCRLRYRLSIVPEERQERDDATLAALSQSLGIPEVLQYLRGICEVMSELTQPGVSDEQKPWVQLLSEVYQARFDPPDADQVLEEYVKAVASGGLLPPQSRSQLEYELRIAACDRLAVMPVWPESIEDILRQELDQLLPRPKRIVCQRIGIDGPPVMLKHIAAELGVTRGAIWQSYKKSLARLRTRLTARGLGLLLRPLHESLIQALELTRIAPSVQAERVRLQQEYGRVLATLIATAESVGKLRIEGATEWSQEIQRWASRLDDTVQGLQLASQAQTLLTPVTSLELTVRTRNGLRAAELWVVGQVVQRGEGDLLRYRNFGRKSLRELHDVLGTMGLTLGMTLPIELQEAVQAAGFFARGR